MRRAALLASVALASSAAFAGCGSILGIEDAFLVPKSDSGSDSNLDELGVCADPQTDPHNCGRCGHDCLGGACTEGHCQPVVVATGQVNPTAIASDGTTAFWISDTQLVSAPAAGGGPVAVLATLPFRPTKIVPTSSGVFVGGAGQVVRFDVDAGVASSMTASDAGTPALVPLAADSTDVFFWEAPGIQRRSLAADAGALVVTAADCRDLALDGTQVYWSSATAIQRASKSSSDGGASTLAAASTPSRVVAVGGFVYYLEGAAGRMTRAPLDGGAPSAAADCRPAVNLAADEAYAYCAAPNGIYRVGASGTTDVVVTTSASPSSIAVDNPSVLYALEGSGDVLRLAK